MSHTHDHEHEDFKVEKRPQNKVVWVIWNIMFVLFYPVLAVFFIFKK